MRKLFFVLAATSAGAAVLAWWRRHPRAGAGWMNRVVDPWLVRQGVIEASDGELGLLEHVGRVTGRVRLTPVHPVVTETGFRVVVPLGGASQWAQNVLAAGHCRLQVGPFVHELDEPSLVPASSIPAVGSGIARAMDWLGFRYLLLHRYAQHEGSLQPVESEGRPEEEAAASQEVAPVEESPVLDLPLEATPAV